MPAGRVVSDVPWLSVNWDRWFTWREAGPVSGRDSPDYFMSPPEADDALLRVLSAGPVSQIVVSTGDLEARIDRSIRLAFPGRAASAPAAASHARPELARPYLEPRDPPERLLAEIWREALGLEKVGVQDDFFELGGDSVLGLQIVAKANEAGLRLTPKQIFEHHTIEELAVAAGSSAQAPEADPPLEAERPRELERAAFPAARLSQKRVDKFLTKLGGARGTQSK